MSADRELPRNLSFARRLFVAVGSPLLGGFVMFARPDKEPCLYIALAFLVLLSVAIRWPRPARASAD